jgi:hypothetical protein
VLFSFLTSPYKTLDLCVDMHLPGFYEKEDSSEFGEVKAARSCLSTSKTGGRNKMICDIEIGNVSMSGVWSP